MAASTEAVTLSSSAYVALSSGQATVLVHVDSPTKIAIGTSLPSADTANWFPLSGDEGDNQMAFEGLDPTENVYARPMDAVSNAIARVMRQ